MNIQFVDIARQNKIHRREYQSAINKILKQADFIQGAAVMTFEQNFAKFCQVKYCVSVNSGTDALFFALLALGIGPGDEVITAPNSYFSTAMVIEQAGAKTVFADIDPETHTINPQEIAKKITGRTKAIIPIHLYGRTANMDGIVKLARKHNLKIIEDCCQAHGAKHKGKPVPFTETGAFSFYPGKNLGSFGDGGALVTNDKRIAEKIKLLRNDGSPIKYTHVLMGYKSRLDTLQAAILNIKLRYLNSWNAARRTHAKLYTELLKPTSAFVQTPISDLNGNHIYHLYVIETEKRNELQAYLLKRGVHTVIHYPTPIHLQAPYKRAGYRKGDFPITETKAKRILSLPMFPELTKEEIIYVVNYINKFFKEAN